MTEQPPEPVPVFVPPGGTPPPGYVPYYPSAAITPKKSNGTATASLIVSGSSLGLLIFTLGIIAPLSLIASIVGTVLGYRAKTATDEDSELGGRDEAQAGFWTGIAGIVLSVIAIILWVVFIAILIAADPNTSIDGESLFEDSSFQ